MPTDLVVFGASIIGATVGASLTYAGALGIQRARPKIALQGCTISSDQALNSEPASLNTDLLLKCELTAELTPYIDRDDRILENEYVEFLQKARADLELHIERRPAFQTAINQLQECLTAHEWDHFQETWANNYYVLWQPLVNAFNKGQLRFPEERSLTEESHPKSMSSQSGLVILSIANGRKIDFWHDADDPAQEAFTLRAATSMATGDVADLQLFINEFRRYVRDAHLSNLLEEVKAELKKFARVVITGHVANTGRLPCSIMNRVKLFVFSSDLVVSAKTNGNKPGTPGTYGANHSLELSFGAPSADGDGSIRFDSPVTVHAGGLVPFVALSYKPLSSLGDLGEEVDKILSGGQASAQMGYRLSKPGKTELAVQYTELFKFIDSGELIDIPEKPESTVAKLFGKRT